MISRALLLLLFPILFLTAPQVLATEQQEIRFGSVAEDIPQVMHQRLTPLTDYLEKAIGRRVILALSPTMDRAIEDVSVGNVELAYLTPVAYIRAHDQGNARLLAKIVTDKQASFRMEIVVREASPIKKVADLAGKSFAFADPASLLQKVVVVNAGMPLESLGSINHLGHHDNVVRGVLNGDYDAGIIAQIRARKWDKKGLRVIYTSPQLPPYNITATGKIDPAVFAKLQGALLSLDSRNPAHRRVFEAMGGGIEGFVRTSDEEYEIVRKLIKPFKQ